MVSWNKNVLQFFKNKVGKFGEEKAKQVRPHISKISVRFVTWDMNLFFFSMCIKIFLCENNCLATNLTIIHICVPPRSPRCKGKIFETERKASKVANWHRKCFTCCKCSRMLDSTLNYFYDGPDGELYCKVGKVQICPENVGGGGTFAGCFFKVNFLRFPRMSKKI